MRTSSFSVSLSRTWPFFAMLGSIALSGCRDFHTERQVGAFVLRSHVRQYILSWENNSELRYKEFCNVVDGSCFIEDEALKRGYSTTVKFAEPYPGEMIAIISNNFNGSLLERPRLRIFETTGQELECRECTGSEIRPRDVLQSYWRGKGVFFLHTHSARADSPADVFWSATVIGNEFTIQKIKEIGLRDTSVRIKRPNLSEDGAKLAWLFCDGDCELVVRTLANGAEDRSPVDCPSGTDPKIRWSEHGAFYVCD